MSTFFHWISFLFSDGILANPHSPTLTGSQQIIELAKDNFEADEVNIEKTVLQGVQKTKNYVSQSAVALRCRVMPPPCIKNPISRGYFWSWQRSFWKSKIKVCRYKSSLQRNIHIDDIPWNFDIHFPYPLGTMLVLFTS